MVDLDYELTAEEKAQQEVSDDCRAEVWEEMLQTYCTLKGKGASDKEARMRVRDILHELAERLMKADADELL